jgi:hypothetical protein
LCLAFLLGACAGGSDVASSSSGVFPATQVAVASKTDKALSPMQAHMAARNQVDPQGRKGNTMVKLATNVERDLREMKSDFKGLKALALRVEETPAGRLAAIQTAAGDEDSTARIKAVRIGDHAGKTRLVFDVEGRLGYSHEVDNKQKVLLISMAAAAFDAPKQKVFSHSQMLKAYVAKPSKDGKILVALKLNERAKVLKSKDLGVNAQGVRRVYLDIAPL